MSRLGLGTYHLTSDRYVSNASARALTSAAIARGINVIDTAPMYGLGEAERIVGEVLKNTKERPNVIGKVGRFEKSILARLAAEAYGDPGLMHAQLDHSLTLLGIDRLPLLLIHETDWAEWGLGDQPEHSPVWAFVEEARRDGRIGAVGLSVRKPAVAAGLAETGLFDAMLFVHYHNVIWQEVATEALAAAHRHDMGVAIGAPFRQGLLVDGSPSAVEALRAQRRAAVPPGVIRRIEMTYDISQQHGMSMVELGLRWLLSDPRVHTTIVGPRSLQELQQNVDFAHAGPLDDNLLEELRLVQQEPLDGQS